MAQYVPVRRGILTLTELDARSGVGYVWHCYGNYGNPQTCAKNTRHEYTVAGGVPSLWAVP